MSKITQHIQPITDYPKLGDSHEIFRKKADIAWHDLSVAIPQMNSWATQANDLRDEVNKFHNDVNNWKNLTYGYKVDAEKARNEIKGCVIPTNATWSKENLDNAFSEVSRVLTAHEIVISYLQKQVAKLSNRLGDKFFNPVPIQPLN